jgi:hypothetical protein
MQATRWTQGGHRHGQQQPHFDERDGREFDADDLARWLAEMDRMVVQYGEEIICPVIFANSFQSDGPFKVWYLGMPSVVRTMITTRPGCWDRFKQLFSKRFLIDVSPRLRQLMAEERELRPGVPCATFAIWKIYYMQCADPHLAPGAAIAMVKRELGWEAAAFCRERENIDDFISELTEFDEQQLEQQAEEAVARWFAEVDRMVLQDGEEIVCPKIFANSFKSDDGFKVWCLGMPPVVTTMITTKPGCWNRFKSLFSKWFFTDVSPSIADFISELTEFDEQKLKHQEKTTTGEPEQPTRPPDKRLQYSPIPPASSYGMPPKSSNVLYTDPRLPTVQARRRRARTYAGEAELPGTIGSNLYHPQYGERPLCLNLDVSNDDVASEATKTKYDGEFSAQKHQEKTTTDEPEQPDESVDNSISELIEFDQQKLEQQEYPDVVVDDSEHPMVLDENQAVATTSMTTVDTRKVEKSLRLDWQLDLVRPASPRTSHGTTVGTELHGTIGSHLYHPRYGENPPCLNLDVGDDYMEGEATTKKNDGERNAKSIRTTNDGE